MKYKVIEYFEDVTDNRKKYFPGDIYPRKGLKPTAERIKELSTDKNRRKIPLIEEIQEENKETQTEAES